jgi:hypothetical protein
MIKIAAMLIGPFQTVLTQDFGKAVKKHGVIRANGVIGNRELQGQRDECERDNPGRTQIAFGVHLQKFEQLECLFPGVTNAMPETPISGRAVDEFRSLSIRRRFQDF